MSIDKFYRGVRVRVEEEEKKPQINADGRCCFEENQPLTSLRCVEVHEEHEGFFGSLEIQRALVEMLALGRDRVLN